jgi:hypothetical protein
VCRHPEKQDAYQKSKQSVSGESESVLAQASRLITVEELTKFTLKVATDGKPVGLCLGRPSGYTKETATTVPCN